LAGFRVFVAKVETSGRVLERLEAAIMNQLYHEASPLCDVPDRGMMLAPKRETEEPIAVWNVCGSTLHGLPAAARLVSAARGSDRGESFLRPGLGRGGHLGVGSPPPTVKGASCYHDLEQIIGSCYKMRCRIQRQPSHISDSWRIPRFHSPAFRWLSETPLY
jgi:hypothetical protein